MTDVRQPGLLVSVLLGAAAGALGWGIRGQYGHETGAMLAGALVGFTLVLLYCAAGTSLRAARAVALCAVGVSFGGSMTYGQTIGLTQDPALIGQASALCWGLWGLFLKGGIWIGLAGALVGMGLGGQRYRPGAMLLVMLSLTLLMAVGLWWLNRPFDPAAHRLPRLYFSDDWSWQVRSDWRPRPECWGGLLLAWLGLVAYLQFVRRDWIARNMALAGFLAGGIGFAGGQCIQALHAWHPAVFQVGVLARWEPFVNWWNIMEITFGAFFGGGLAAGCWFHRRTIAADAPADEAELTAAHEAGLAALYAVLILAAEFSDWPSLEWILEFGLVLGMLPLVGILGGRYFPYWFALPLVALPIAGKTLRDLSYRHDDVPLLIGWIILAVVPVGTAAAASWWLAWRGGRGQRAADFARVGLLVATWLYFGLNWAFFRGPWPWQKWTGRTPSGLIFTVCAVVLTLGAWRLHRHPQHERGEHLEPIPKPRDGPGGPSHNGMFA
ncbi:MAG: hypothetical protein MUF48_16185 [Pirellulaceae bacterium]|jgi:hypothetical protein|nr:hypothetical protein [Pirellulaceae bacterium]